ncbi:MULTISPECIES: ATP-binding protein [Rhizobium]|uniref:ATP-binding protein n=1 Tax=Rhizobium TaxID=379 RepID=UPI001040A65C|nr:MULTISPECIES: ATP-binding protein [Rhizobium]MBY4593302.1 response regulator [Rhizobium redzepovicii]MBY4617900.1 response regulator [Rhizobium redzepovicii]TBY44535.1 response regulator [Rhizobium leguminosarum bv. viciae]
MNTASRFPAERLQQVLDSAVDTGIIMLDVDGTITGWSKGAETLLGWSQDEMLSKTLVAIFPPEGGAAALLEAELTDARSKGKGSGEGWRLQKGGGRIWAVGETTPIMDDERKLVGFVKVLRDRTEQRETEMALRERTRALEILNRAGADLARENDLEKVVQLVTDAGVELTGAQFGAFFYNVINPSGESYMLYTLSGVPREAFSKFPMPRNTAVFAPTFLGEGIVRSADITQDSRYGKNEPRRGMPEGHLPVRSYLAVPVISRTGEVIGGLFFGHADIGVFDAASESGLAGLAGEAAVAIDNARLFDAVQRELQERRRAEEALKELNANLEHLVKQKTEELTQNAEALRQAQKLEAIGQLTGGVAHDFNNLLQIIVGNLDTLTRNLPPEAGRLRRAASQAMNGARRAAALTQRLLAFARRQPLDPKPIDTNSLIRGMSELLHRTLGEIYNIEVVLAAGLWKAEADPNELESALLNLAINARDAMPDGGKLTIETFNAHLDEAYASSHAEVIPGQYTAISVSDTGTGMDTETLSHVFEPFFTTKDQGKGTGLGLSQVYGFVKQSKGHVKIYSEVGEGTTVKIYLPRLFSDGAGEEVAEAPAIPEAAAGEVILVVEDDPDVRAYSVESLRELGYHVLEAKDGPAALQALSSYGNVDLIFSDVVLPSGMSGADVVAKARETNPTQKALFTTGYSRNAIVHHGRLDKGVHLLPKPFSFEDLAVRVRDVLDRN